MMQSTEEKLVSHWSALALMEIPYLESFFEARIEENTKEDHYVVFSPKHRRRRSGQKIHLCVLDLPDSAKQCRDGVHIVSPEYAFLQAAGDLSKQEVIVLAELMCGSPQEAGTEPVTTLEKLIAFAVKAKGHRGRRKVLSALRYVRERSRSPLEIAAHILLCLPHKLGGAAFTTGVLDYRIDLDKEAARKMGTDTLHADLAFPEHMVAIEYDSKENHSTHEEQANDAKRAEAMEAMGYTVISIGPRDLYNLDGLYELIKKLEVLLGKSPHPTASHYAEGFERIHDMLPRHDTDFAGDPWGNMKIMKHRSKERRRFFTRMRVKMQDQLFTPSRIPSFLLSSA